MRAFLLTVCLALAVSANQLRLLSDYPAARCLDGSFGGYWRRPAGTEEGRNKWLIFFQGGGVCTSPESCYKRSLTDLGSSTHWLRNISGRSAVLQGPLSANCTINPDFCNFNLVYIGYCDGLIYSGERISPVMYESHPLYLRGADIRRAVIEDLANTTDFANATTVVISGCSAGGLATFVHGDQIAASIRRLAPGVTKLRALPVSGFFLTDPNAQFLPILEALVVTMLREANGTGEVNRDCLTRTGNPDACMFSENVFAVSKLPTFVLNSKSDAWQIACTVLGAERADGTGFNCLAAEPWSSCVQLRTDPVFGSCNASQVLPMLWFQQSFMNRVWSVDGFHRPGSGAFISSCFTHCEAVMDYYWTSLQIDGVTMQAAVSAWWNDESGTTPSQLHTRIDCARPYSAPYSCNPTCVPPMNDVPAVDASWFP